MKTRLLVLALLAAPAASRAAPLPQDAALIKVEQQEAGWRDWQLRSAQMESAYVDDAIKSSADRTLKCLSDVDKIEAQAERRMRNWRDSRLAAWNAQAAAGAITADEAARRAGFAERLFEMRMLLIYGNLMPRTVDNCAHGDDEAERRLSGGPWAVAATKKEFDLAETELVRVSGLSDEDAYAR